jgi:hypothetical protein
MYMQVYGVFILHCYLIVNAWKVWATVVAFNYYSGKNVADNSGYFLVFIASCQVGTPNFQRANIISYEFNLSII